MTDLRRLALCLGLAISASAALADSSWATKCLDAPSTAQDTADIAYVRRVIDTFCDCSTFDGETPATSHGSYVKCASSIAVAKAKAGKLRNECKGFVNKIYAKS